MSLLHLTLESIKILTRNLLFCRTLVGVNPIITELQRFKQQTLSCEYSQPLYTFFMFWCEKECYPLFKTIVVAYKLLNL